MDVDLATERHALDRALAAVEAKLQRLAGISGGGADALADEYIDAVVRGTIDQLQHELVVFGRIDDDQPWRVGLYGIDRDGEQLVVDWRAPFAGAFYQARFDEPLGLERRVTYVGSIVDLFVEDFASGEVSGTSPLLGELSRSRGKEMRTAVATLQSEQDELVRLDPTAKLVLRGGPGHRQDRGGAAPRRLARLQRHPADGRPHPRDRPERPVPPLRRRRAPDAGRGPHRADHVRPPARPVERGGQRRAVARRARPVRGRHRAARAAQGRAAPHRRGRGGGGGRPGGAAHAALARPAADLRRAPRRPPRAGPGAT